jgi:hypothetical protein
MADKILIGSKKDHSGLAREPGAVRRKTPERRKTPYGPSGKIASREKKIRRTVQGGILRFAPDAGTP